MSILSYYLLATFFFYYTFYPKSKISILKHSIIIPLIISTLCFLIISIQTTSSYETGSEFSKFVIPTFISMIVLFFQFSYKMKNEGKTKFPIILIISIIVTFFIGIQQDEIKKENDKYFKEYLKKENSIDNIKYSTKQMKAKLPITTPDTLVFYDVFYNDKNNSVEYLYKSEIYELKDLNKVAVDNFKSEWRNNLISVFKNSKNSNDFITSDVSIIYKLEDKVGKQIFSFTLSPKEVSKK